MDQAVGQYAYRLESAGHGRGASALVALGNDKLMILERNNRGDGTGTQFDVYFRFSDADPCAASIHCPTGQTASCFLTANNATAARLTADYQLLPGVLQAYTATVNGDVSPVPEAQALTLMLRGLPAMGVAARRRRMKSGFTSPR